MKENTQEKNLVEKSKKTLFGKIKNFFKKIFSKKEIVQKECIVENNNDFKENLKIEEDEEAKLLELQKRYHNGEIEAESLTDEQIDRLCLIYDKKIAEIRKTIKMKEEQIEAYKKERQQRLGKHSM